MKEVSHELLELIGALKKTPRVISDWIVNLDDPTLRNKPLGDEFSITENICHLRDIEIEGYETRINKILSETNPLLLDIDGGRLAAERNYNQQDPITALNDFAAARRRNTTTLGGLTDEQLDREGSLQGVGTVTIRKLIEMMHEHDEGHLDELRRLA